MDGGESFFFVGGSLGSNNLAFVVLCLNHEENMRGGASSWIVS